MDKHRTKRLYQALVYYWRIYHQPSSCLLAVQSLVHYNSDVSYRFTSSAGTACSCPWNHPASCMEDTSKRSLRSGSNKRQRGTIIMQISEPAEYAILGLLK